uniref:Putative ovule protein n=2 Tax=Solanum chacoense TaxID=4108 RepID=A0A0V0GT84_SOLCH
MDPRFQTSECKLSTLSPQWYKCAVSTKQHSPISSQILLTLATLRNPIPTLLITLTTPRGTLDFKPVDADSLLFRQDSTNVQLPQMKHSPISSQFLFIFLVKSQLSKSFIITSSIILLNPINPNIDVSSMN